MAEVNDQGKKWIDMMTYTMRRRAIVVQSIAKVIREKKWNKLDENDYEDIRKVLNIVFELYPLTHAKTAKDYAHAAIVISKR